MVVAHVLVMPRPGSTIESCVIVCSREIIHGAVWELE